MIIIKKQQKNIKNVIFRYGDRDWLEPVLKNRLYKMNEIILLSHGSFAVTNIFIDDNGTEFVDVIKVASVATEEFLVGKIHE